jgi:heme exporter protein D
MPQIRRVLFLTIVWAAFALSVAHAQATSDQSLKQRLDSLERQVVDLDRRLLRLEASQRGAPAAEPATNGSSSDITNWRRLREGMSYSDVRELLGDPTRVDGGSVASWAYPRHGRVDFVSGKVTSWSEPSQ